MPITYTDVTYIQNGQAITADNLNAPSVDLTLRTEEIKRESDLSIFNLAHTSDATVVLVSSSPETASVTIRTELKADGSPSGTLVKYYLPEFNDLNFSVYSKAVHGGRYIIPGSQVGALFSDTIDGSNSVYSTALTVPGDGIYAKIPLRHTGDSEALINYPDLAYPKSKADSLGDEYLSNALTAELVKLPELVLVDFLSSVSGENVASFISRLQTQFADIDAISVSDVGELTILDSSQEPLSLRIYGTQEGAECKVTHLLERPDGEPGFVAKLSRASAPIYIEHSERISTAGIGVTLLRDSAEIASSLVPISNGSYTGYFILPELLNPSYSYIPLVRLTEHSLLVGDKSIPLVRRQLPNGSMLNKHGDPIYGVPLEFTTEESAEYSIRLLSDNRISVDYKKAYVLDIGEYSLVAGEGYLSASGIVPPDIEYLKTVLQNGDRVFVDKATIAITEDIVSTLQDPAWQVNASVFIDGNIQGAVFYPSAQPTVGDSLELSFSSPITVAGPATDFYLSVAVRDSDDGDLVSGAIKASFSISIL